MTIITRNEKTGRVTIEEDGTSNYYGGALVQGASTIKVSVSAEDYAEVMRYYDEISASHYGNSFTGENNPYIGDEEFYKSLAACKSYHVIRKERVID